MSEEKTKKQGFFIYADAWLRDTRHLTPSARGAWIDLLLVMATSDRFGVAVFTHAELARLWGVSRKHADDLLAKLTGQGPGFKPVCEISICDEKITLTNRRMVREHNLKLAKSKAGAASVHARSVRTNTSTKPQHQQEEEIAAACFGFSGGGAGGTSDGDAGSPGDAADTAEPLDAVDLLVELGGIARQNAAEIVAAHQPTPEAIRNIAANVEAINHAAKKGECKPIANRAGFFRASIEKGRTALDERVKRWRDKAVEEAAAKERKAAAEADRAAKAEREQAEQARLREAADEWARMSDAERLEVFDEYQASMKIKVRQDDPITVRACIALLAKRTEATV